jgi:poly-beta-1,6-N-acetyl-D-glucosamine synthase
MSVQNVCVIVPARNEAAVIETTLRSLLTAGIPQEQIYLVDDCSSDGTGAIGLRLGVNVLRNDPNLGKAHAIARVVDTFKLSERFELIALMDADTLVDKGYFAAMRKAFDDPEVVTACGRPKSQPCNWITAYRANGYWSTHVIFRKAQSKVRVISVAPGCATVYRASIWPELDWSKDTLVEDVDVTLQIYAKKLGRIIYVPEAVVYTQDPQTMRDYTKQMLRWSTGNWQVYRKHKLYLLKRRIDWEFLLLFGEGLISSILYLVMMFGLFVAMLADIHTSYVIFLVNSALVSAFALVAAIAERRIDIFLASPLFPLIRIYDSWVFVWSFWKVIIRRKAATVWFSPARYKQEN